MAMPPEAILLISTVQRLHGARGHGFFVSAAHHVGRRVPAGQFCNRKYLFSALNGFATPLAVSTMMAEFKKKWRCWI
jgi:hypothetical protein